MSFSALLHSVSYSGSWGQAHLPLDQFIDKAADLGYEGVMLMAKRPHLSLLDYGPKERAQLRQHLEKRNLHDLCIAGYNNFTGDLEHGEVPQREIQVHYITELARLTHDLGGNLVRIFTGYENPAGELHGPVEPGGGSAQRMRQARREFGVTIGVQNHHDIAVGYESQYDLIQAVGEPNCKALFDAWAPALHGEDLDAAARKMAPITVHTTIAAYQKRPRYHYDSAVVNYTALDPLRAGRAHRRRLHRLPQVPGRPARGWFSRQRRLRNVFAAAGRRLDGESRPLRHTLSRLHPRVPRPRRFRRGRFMTNGQYNYESPNLHPILQPSPWRPA